jgi:very-short-patch-repair endonuclease
MGARIPWNKGKKGLQIGPNTGRKFSAEHRERISKALKGKFKSKEHLLHIKQETLRAMQAPEMREKLSKIMTGKRPIYSKEEMAKKINLFKTTNPMHNLESKEKHRKSISKWAKRFYNTPEGREIQRQRRALVIMPRKDTLPERILQEALAELGIAVTLHKNLRLSNGSWHAVDIFIEPNICLEVDGEYWHSRPEQMERDRFIDEDLGRQGYAIYRIRERDITGRGRDAT